MVLFVDLNFKQFLIMRIVSFVLLMLVAFAGFSQDYENYFTNDRLRLDLYHYGDDNSEKYSLKGFVKESPWAGPRKNMVKESMLHGTYVLQVKDAVTDKVLYNHPFETMFEEWQETIEAPNRERVFEESLIIPYPKSAVIIEILVRDVKLDLHLVYTKKFDPATEWVEERTSKYESELIHGDKSFDKGLDIAIVAEGYTAIEMDKFMKDSKAMVDFFFNTKPFDKHKKDVNFYCVKAISEESGTDLPGKDIWKNTAADSKFYTFGSERYLTTLAYHKTMDLLSSTPFDQVLILVNTPKYGGGGVFNHFSVASADHELSKIVFTHEFGHAFGGLADEYYTSSTAYVTTPDLTHEIMEPNVTNLVKFDEKWKSMMDKNTPIPTPDTEEYNQTVGVFEGGRYMSKGIYRPVRNCRMKSNTAPFCPVCQKVLSDMIKYYSGK